MSRFSLRAFAVIAATLFAGLTMDMDVQVALASPPTPPASGGGVSLQPLHPDMSDPASSAYFALHARPGATLRDTVHVTNTSKAAVNLIVSSVDGLTGQTSGAVYANRQDPVREAGTWVTPSVRSFRLVGGASRNVSFTVEVPGTAVPGDHLAGVAVENADPTSSTGGFQIKQVLRSVIGVRVVVAGPAAFHPQLTSLGLKQLGGTQLAAVYVGLGNDG
ncbi:MAG TPA: DUF916 domain-containing protein, partial [Jatrophihabitans sp.]